LEFRLFRLILPPNCKSFASCGAVLLCAAVFLAAGSSPAQAACGDWLSHAEGGADQVAAKANLPHRPAPAPCDGPKCRRTPVSPAPLVPTQLIPRAAQDRIVCELTIRIAGLTLCETFARADGAKPCDGHQSAIEHPPR
jgi:hypothetical protein